MASTIKPIEASSVHQIQSGQVIVDLCSVVKELVENALDADASSIEVRFKNYGLDAIEVQDNGTGIAEANYESLGLKHYTSKLSTYDDLTQLQTFGFRGEALSSLCALSTLTVTTAQAHEAPKGKKLEFETSGKLKSSGLIAATKGTIVSVEGLFSKLPVRQKELSKNIKREYGKVLGLLHAYACISTQVKFTVKNALPKARSTVAFSTKGNATTRDNIANVYGAKTLPHLIELDLQLEVEANPAQSKDDDADALKVVKVVGHISRPIYGEGRQTPDRQMFYVNGRPCGLPQFAKAINEVYKSYNVSQSPFIFADFRMDTNSYDVNVTPDKRTIYLHDAAALTDRLKAELTKNFDLTEQTIPQSQMSNLRLPSFKPLSVSRSASRDDEELDTPLAQASDKDHGPGRHPMNKEDDDEPDASNTPPSLFKSHFGNITSTREEQPQSRKPIDPDKVQKAQEKQAAKIAEAVEKAQKRSNGIDKYDDVRELNAGAGKNNAPDEEDEEEDEQLLHVHVRDFNARMNDAKQPEGVSRSRSYDANEEPRSKEHSDEMVLIPASVERSAQRRVSPESTGRSVTDAIGISKLVSQQGRGGRTQPKPSQFSQRLRKFDMVEQDQPEELPNGEDQTSEHDDEDEQPSLTQGISKALPWADVQSTTRPRPVVEDQIGLVSNVPTNTQAIQLNAAKDAEANADRTQEEYRVAELIRMAENANYVNSKEHQRRINQALKGGTKDTTVSTVAVLNVELDALAEAASEYKTRLKAMNAAPMVIKDDQDFGEEERLSLTISKSDFSQMHIAGQFNLGFIIALRPKHDEDASRQKDELFIVDQHASDEKYNFERLQIETTVGNQRLVHPILLDLTAVEEEVVLENTKMLQQNGFIMDADLSGGLPVGQRCRLLSLPLSKEVTFNTKDLEELIHLLSESHVSADSAFVPRPSKVRKMFAMRACRSSIMIGKTLSMKQMRSVLDHMGQIDKPWNCPHGRPTMRHLISLDDLDNRLWREGDNVVSAPISPIQAQTRGFNVWRDYIA